MYTIETTKNIGLEIDWEDHEMDDLINMAKLWKTMKQPYKIILTKNGKKMNITKEFNILLGENKNGI